MEAGVIVLFALVVVGVLVVGYLLREARKKAFAALAARMGWSYAPADPFGLLGLPFRLFHRGDGRGVENVLWGEHAGHQIRAFEYWYYQETQTSKGTTSRSYSRFTCAALPLGLRCPETSISKESFLSRVADVAGFRDIDFESEEFNRAMQVKSADKRFASYLIDARMMTWLLSNKRWTFLLSGEWLLAVSGRLPPHEVPVLVDALTGFRAQVPEVVFETYGSR